MRGALTLFCTLFLFSPLQARNTQFSGPNAFRLLQVIAGDVGPRPMGSPGEQRAMAFALAELRAAGCDTSYIMPVTVANRVNTSTGVTVGVVRGATGRIIVLGAHIDSSAPDVPGANDNGSGSACVIELARVLARRANMHTLMFCLWGGEEDGLIGSTAFVRDFADGDSIDMMISLDMADGSGVLIADPDGEQESAPPWLVRAAFEAAENHGYDDVVYRAGEAALNRAAGGATGSDHVPFLERGIPAIDFTSDITYPIHSPLDNLLRFDPSGLQRSGDIALTLVERFDGGIPGRSTARYLLLQSGSFLVFVPGWILYAAPAAALVLILVALITLALRRPAAADGPRVRLSLLKVLAATLLVQVFVWESETAAGALAGLRFPWVNNVAGYMLLGALSGLIGLWCALAVLRRFRLSSDPYVFARGALILLGLGVIGAAFRGVELGTLAATIVIPVTLALVLRNLVFRLLLLTAAAVLTWRLVFFESLGLLQREWTQSLRAGFLPTVVPELVFILLGALITLPFILSFAALYRSSGIDLFWLRRFRRPTALVPLGLAVLVTTIVLIRQPVYGESWTSVARAEATHRYGSDSLAVLLTGSESLRDLRLSVDGRDSLIPDDVRGASMPFPPSHVDGWLTLEKSGSADSLASDSTMIINRTITLHTAFRPARVDIWYQSEDPFGLSSKWEFRDFDPKRRRFSWYWFPDTLIVLPVRLTVGRRAAVAEEVRVVFDSLAVPLSMARFATTTERRTVITALDTVRASTR